MKSGKFCVIGLGRFGLPNGGRLSTKWHGSTGNRR